MYRQELATDDWKKLFIFLEKYLGTRARKERPMCTGIVETREVSGSGKGPRGWFKLERVSVSYDHPTDAQLDHALNIDFVNEKEGPSARVAVELSQSPQGSS